ncbi:MAG: hypothetical protein HYU64_09360 [Armatimonadetes bacterium]|nr:hypothetical protein [Armatimonadota bacterium]
MAGIECLKALEALSGAPLYGFAKNPFGSFEGTRETPGDALDTSPLLRAFETGENYDKLGPAGQQLAALDQDFDAALKAGDEEKAEAILKQMMGIGKPVENQADAATNQAQGAEAAAPVGEGKATPGGFKANQNTALLNDPKLGPALQKFLKKGAKYEDAVKQLKADGIQAELSEVKGKKAIKFGDGKYIYDIDGDGSLNKKDFGFKDAKKAVEGKLGVNQAAELANMFGGNNGRMSPDIAGKVAQLQAMKAMKTDVGNLGKGDALRAYDDPFVKYVLLQSANQARERGDGDRVFPQIAKFEAALDREREIKASLLNLQIQGNTKDVLENRLGQYDALMGEIDGLRNDTVLPILSDLTGYVSTDAGGQRRR